LARTLTDVTPCPEYEFNSNQSLHRVPLSCDTSPYTSVNPFVDTQSARPCLSIAQARAGCAICQLSGLDEQPPRSNTSVVPKNRVGPLTQFGPWWKPRDNFGIATNKGLPSILICNLDEAGWTCSFHGFETPI
jgi:hypothetical protein